MVDDLDLPTRDPLRLVTLSLVALMVVAFAGQLVFQVVLAQAQRTTSECYQDAFDRLTASNTVARQAAAQDRAQLQELVTSLIERPGRDDQLAALDRWTASLEVTDRARAEAPVPGRRC